VTDLPNPNGIAPHPSFKGFTRCSPSQLKTFSVAKAGGCKRKWWFQKVAKIRPPVDLQRQLTFDYGTVTHQLLEDYLLGEDSDLGEWPEDSKEAFDRLYINKALGGMEDTPLTCGWLLKMDNYQAAALPYLDKIMEKYGTGAPVVKKALSPDQVEHEFSFDTPVGVQLDGISDVFLPRFVVDHKTTSNSRWAMNENAASRDPQTVVYVKANRLVHGGNSTKVNYNYIQKPGKSLPPKCWQVRLEVGSKHNDREMDKVYLQLEDMLEVAQIEDWREVEMAPTKNPCKRDFGGCEYYDICYASNSLPSFTTVENTVNAKERMKAALAAKKANKENPPKPEAPAEPVEDTTEGATDTQATNFDPVEEAIAVFKATGESRMDLLETQEQKKAFIAWRAEDTSQDGINPPDARPNHPNEGNILDGEEVDGVELLSLPTKTEEALREMGCTTLADVAAVVTDGDRKAEFLDMKGMGPSKIGKLEEALVEAGYDLDGTNSNPSDGNNVNSPTTDAPPDVTPEPQETVSGAPEPSAEPARPAPSKTPAKKDAADGPVSLEKHLMLLISCQLTKDETGLDVMHGYEIMKTINDHYKKSGGEEGHVGSIPYGGSKGYIAEILNKSLEAGKFGGKTICIDRFEFGADVMIQCFAPYAIQIVRGM